MRLPKPTPPDPTLLEFDVAISQMMGLAADGDRVRTQPTGGSEFQVVLLAEALARAGYRVGVISPVFAFMRKNGVDYIPNGEVLGRPDINGERRPSVKIRCNVLVSERVGAIPPIEFKRVVFDLHDLPDPRIDGVMAMMQQVEESRIVVHSPFMQSLLVGWPRVSVIPCMLPDEFYEHPRAHKLDLKQKRYVYGSAALKGIEPTLALWRELKRTKSYNFKHATLTITSPGYDAFDPKLLDGQKDVEVYTGISPAGMQRLLSASDGLFMCSTYPETFGIVMAQAEIAGVPAHVLQMHGHEDALHTTLANPETLFTESAPFVESFHGEHSPKPAKDYRVSSHIGTWIDVLGLNKAKEQAA